MRDAQKTRDYSAETMLKLLREEVSKNRTTYSRLVREAQEKGQRCAQFESALSEPSVRPAPRGTSSSGQRFFFSTVF